MAVSVRAVNKGVNMQEGYKILMRRRKHLVYVDVCTLILFPTLSINILYQILS